jgi:DNA polymerase-3 subunit alpha
MTARSKNQDPTNFMAESLNPTFVHLRLHTEYSLVDGLVDVKPLVKRCAALGMPAVAVTDQSNLFALVKFYKAAMDAGIKPVAGADVRLYNAADPAAPHALSLYVQNETGYRNLTELISRAYQENQHQGMPQIMAQWLEAKNEGLIALSGGRQGDIGLALLAGNKGEARRLLEHWLKVFDQRFYLELQRTDRPREEEYLELAVELAVEFEAPVVATNDVRFLQPTDFEAHEARVCIYQGRVLDDPRRPRDYSDRQYLRSPEEMAALFADLPEALENTVEIARRCNIGLTLGKNFLPNFPVPEGMTPQEYFAEQSRQGLEERMTVLIPPDTRNAEEKRKLYRERLELEISVINQMDFPGYFLIVADFIQWAKNHGIPVGPGRGSGAGSLVAYALKITDLDPIEFDLLFERFLNPERVSMPDFDVDFCMERRDEVIDYVAEAYGRDRVSQIITYGSMAAKAVVRDVGRVLGHSYGFVDKIAKLIPFELGITLDKALNDSEDLRKLYETDEEVKTLIDLAKSLEGITRNPGKHAGGVVIAPSRLIDFAPLYCEQGGDNLVTQFDKDDVEAVGLVKFDFLGLRTLTIIDWALETINDRRKRAGEPAIDINRIPHDDPKAYDLLKRCATTAVFQLESRGMKDLIRRLQPDCFEDIIALVALFRPGPLQSGMVDDYINVKHGRAKAEYPHPVLEPILKPTNGVIVYQEQVMQIARDLAGYTLGGADLLRRCLSGTTPVVDADSGHLITLAELAAHPEKWLGRKVFSLNLDTLKIEPRPITAIYPNGHREVYTVTTSTGRSIKATADHLFYTVDAWKPLADFEPGEAIALAATLPIRHQSEVPEAQIKLVAYLLGDGHLSIRKPANSYFCNSDPELIEDFNRCSEILFGRPAPLDHQLHSGRKTVIYARIGFVSAFNQWIDSHVKRAHSRDKEIPEWVFTLSKAQLRVFIGTLWSTDGSFDTLIGHADYTSTSATLIRQLQHLLLRLGITALFDIKTASYRDTRHVSYRVRITGRQDMLKFMEMVAPHLSASKREMAETCKIRMEDKGYNQSKHQLPPTTIPLIAEAKRVSGMTWAEIDHAVGRPRGTMSSGLNFRTPPTRSLSRERVRYFAVATGDIRLQTLANSEILWDRIVSIEYSGTEEVFDLTIDHNHNFVAGDFIAHNCMGKKKPEEMAQQRTIFLEGSIKNRVDPDVASYIFDLMEKFAGYGFNKSHSAAYALVSYQTAWLKAHFPAAFMAAVLSSDMDNTDKIVVLIEECRDMKLAIQPPDLNRSDFRFTVLDDRTILYGLGAIKGVGETAIRDILAERGRGDPYRDLYDLCKRVDLRKANRRVLEALIRAGALDAIDPNRARHMAELGDALKAAEQHGTMEATGQDDLFGLLDAAVSEASPQPAAPAVEPWPEDERLSHEKATLGLYLTGHPIGPYEAELRHFVTERLGKLAADNDKPATGFRRQENRVVVAGLVVELRTRQSKTGKRMAFATLDDRTGRLEAAVFSEVLENHRDLLAKDILLVVEGNLGFDDFAGQLRLTADKLYSIEQARAAFAKSLFIQWPVPEADDGQPRQLAVDELQDLLNPFRGGNCPILIEYRSKSAKTLLEIGGAWKVRPDDKLLNSLEKRIGAERVKLQYSAFRA